jgi:hypothetical protein
LGQPEEIVGAVLGVVVLLDIFLLVSYAHADTGIISKALAHLMWRGFVWVSKFFGHWQTTVLAFTGPVIRVMILFSWALLLSIAAALVIHPNLGAGVRAIHGETPTDFFCFTLRTQWDRYITLLAPQFAYKREEIDTAVAQVSRE